MFGRNGAVAVALAVACGRTEAPASSAAPGSAGAALISPALASAQTVTTTDGATGGAPADVGWPALVRDERWDAAARALEALPPSEKSRPEVRYVRAHVALAREDAAGSLALLDGLESALPLLAEDIARLRATAKAAAGPFEEAGDWFATHPDPASQLEAARAFDKARIPARARIAAARVLRSVQRTRTQEAEARALRVRLIDSPGEEDWADARWLASPGADVSPIDGLAIVARIDPKHPLSAEELMVRARALADAGRTDDALHSIDLVAGAPGAEKVSELERSRTRGNALFRARGRWGEAARVLSECAAAGGPHAAEDAFHAARALSRADRDEEAIHGYQDVERRYPKSTWAGDAAFFVPYLRMLHAEWQACAGGFDAYLHAHASGDHARDARRDGGLCKLLAGNAKGARLAFERLRDDAALDAVGSGRMAVLAALASLRDGDQEHAIALWTDVVRSHPLSWPALVARAHLGEVGAPIPPAIEAAQPTADSATPLAVPMPPPADLLHALGLDGDAEIALRDRESAVTVGAHGRAAEALCDVYGELGRARRRYQVAQALPSVLLATAPDARNRWAWNCAFPAPYGDEVRAAEEREGLPPGLLWAVMRQESAFDPDAVSPARAVGLMQLLPETARPIATELSIGESDARLTSPSFAIRVGARALRKLLDRFHGDVALSIAAYNAGTDSVERWTSRAQGMQLDTFVERIPYDETREYVVHVMGNLARYGYLARGEAGVPEIDLGLKVK